MASGLSRLRQGTPSNRSSPPTPCRGAVGIDRGLLNLKIISIKIVKNVARP